jgi:hypothetical protein
MNGALLDRARRAWGDLANQIAVNRRLGALIVAIPGIALLYGALLAQDAVFASQQERAPLLRRAARLAAVADGADWTQRVRQEQGRRTLYHAQLWRADSAELAAADLQTVLQRVAARHLSWNQLKIASAEHIDAIGGWRIEAEMVGRLKDDQPLDLLRELAEHAPRIVIGGFDISRQRTQTITLRLSVIAVPEEESP